MPSAAARKAYEEQIPTFMSVFDLDPETMADRDTVTVVDPRLVDGETKQPMIVNPSQTFAHALVPIDPSHKHNDSTSTQMTESADSSPTTTLSTADSSPLSDPSPSSSPDSPVHLVPLNNYPATAFSRLPSKPAPLMSLNPPAPESGFLARPMTSPSPRRPRNMKGLSIQPPSLSSSTQTMVSEPSSPSFIKPKISSMKRKPSMLSLKTNTSDLVNRPIAEVPPSPGMPPILQRRALKHSTSSPHLLPTIKSATFGPAGGMTLPNMLERNESGLSEVLRPTKTIVKTTFENPIKEEESSPIRAQMASRMDAEPYHEKVNNEDQKTPGYPDGPIAIYDDNVYLYLEPTAEEASRFDVVFNVAKEVKNPFDAARFRSPISRTESPIPDTALTNASFATAFEFQPRDDSSSETPTTPKANPFTSPEYIHMPWDHNTDIAPDLMSLCETIDNRIKQGKKVLIHCQQGASRSASLIIAYGMYRKPELSVNDAYYAAQSKSQWISPNMKLMYSLQDFQKEIIGRRPPVSSFNGRNGRSPTKHRLTLSADAIGLSHKEPRTAPLPGEDDSSKDNHLNLAETHRRGNSMPGPQGVSPGPASAPPNLTWQEEAERKSLEQIALPKAAELPERPRQVQQVASHERSASLVSIDPPTTHNFEPPGGFTFQNKSFPRFSNQARLSRDPAQLEQPRLVPPPPTEAPPPPPMSNPVVQTTFAIPSSYTEDEAMMSPRAEVMTNNPLRDISQAAGMRFPEDPMVIDSDEDLFSPRATMFPRDPKSPFGRPLQVADPRSPPTKGETPITRSIDDIL